MHARVVTVQIKAGEADQAVAQYLDGILPITRQQNGFKGASLLLDRAKNRAISVTYWESEADLVATPPTQYLGEAYARMAQHWDGQPVTEQFEVVAQA